MYFSLDERKRERDYRLLECEESCNEHNCLPLPVTAFYIFIHLSGDINASWSWIRWFIIRILYSSFHLHYITIFPKQKRWHLCLIAKPDHRVARGLFFISRQSPSPVWYDHDDLSVFDTIPIIAPIKKEWDSHMESASGRPFWIVKVETSYLILFMVFCLGFHCYL